MFRSIAKHLSDVFKGNKNNITLYDGHPHLHRYHPDHPHRVRLSCLAIEELPYVKMVFDHCFGSKMYLADIVDWVDEATGPYLEARNSDVYALIQSYVRKYYYEYMQITRTAFSLNHPDLLTEIDKTLSKTDDSFEETVIRYQKFEKLLESKGYEVDDSKMVRVIIRERREQNYADFKNKMDSCNPSSAASCMQAFAEIESKSLQDMQSLVEFITGSQFLIPTSEPGQGIHGSGYDSYTLGDEPVSVTMSYLRGMELGVVSYVGADESDGFPSTHTRCADNCLDNSVLDMAEKCYFLDRYIMEREFAVTEYPGMDLEGLIGECAVTSHQKELEIFEHNLLKEEVFSIDAIDSYNGYEFETFLRKLFEAMGYEVTNTKLSGDQGADLVIVRHGQTTVVQAKRYAGSVGNTAVQEVVAAIAHYGADKGMVITSGVFTKSAVQLAASNDISLVDRGELSSLIEKYL